MKKHLFVAALAFATFATFAAGAQTAPKAPKADKAPKAATEKKIRNFDDVEAELDRAEKSLEKTPELPAAPTPPDVDFEKAERELARADKELRENEHISRKELEQARKEIARARAEIAKARNVDMAQARKDIEKARAEMATSFANARKDMAKARAEMKEYRGFEEDLAKDGLIDKNSYTLEHHDGALLINGKKQPEEVYNKYRSFLDKHKRFTWKKNDDGLSIQNDQK